MQELRGQLEDVVRKHCIVPSEEWLGEFVDELLEVALDN